MIEIAKPQRLTGKGQYAGWLFAVVVLIATIMHVWGSRERWLIQMISEALIDFDQAMIRSQSGMDKERLRRGACCRAVAAGRLPAARVYMLLCHLKACLSCPARQARPRRAPTADLQRGHYFAALLSRHGRRFVRVVFALIYIVRVWLRYRQFFTDRRA